MAKEKGWWTLNCTVEPSEYDLEHIAAVIVEGFTSGEIVQEDVELVECSRCGKFCDYDNMEKCFEDTLCKKCVSEITKFDKGDNNKWVQEV